MNVILRDLTPDDETTFLRGATCWVGESPHWYSFYWKEGVPYDEYLEVLRKEKAGIDILLGRVPHTVLYGFAEGEIIGRVSIRHELNEHLSRRGGNIGYAVAPKFRKKDMPQRCWDKLRTIVETN